MSIGRTSMLLTPLAAIARAAAFFVPVAIARWYGVQHATDAFFWALSVPTFVLVLGSTAMGTVLVPVLADMRVQAPDRVAGFLGSTMLWAILAACGLGAAFALASPVLLPELTGFDDPTRDLTTLFCWALLPFLASIATNAVLKTACEVHGSFAAPATGPLLRAVTTLATVWTLLPWGALSLPAGVFAGNFAETLWLGATFRRAGIRLSPSIGLPRELRAAFGALGPVLIGETMVALNIVVDKMFAGTMEPGSVTILEYADRAAMIPRTLLESTLVVVAFNAWASAQARGDDSGRRAAVTSTLWWIVLLAPPVLAGMAIGRVALVRLLFEGGAFDAENTRQTARVLGAFVPGILFSLLGALIVKAHIIERRFRLVMRLGLLSFATNAILNVALGPFFGLAGLAASTSLTTAIVTVVSFGFLAPDLVGTGSSRALRDATAIAGASLALATGAFGLGFAPKHVAEAGLWVASVPCLALLGFGLHRARKGMLA